MAVEATDQAREVQFLNEELARAVLCVYRKPPPRSFASVFYEPMRSFIAEHPRLAWRVVDAMRARAFTAPTSRLTKQREKALLSKWFDARIAQARLHLDFLNIARDTVHEIIRDPAWPLIDQVRLLAVCAKHSKQAATTGIANVPTELLALVKEIVLNHEQEIEQGVSNVRPDVIRAAIKLHQIASVPLSTKLVSMKLVAALRSPAFGEVLEQVSGEERGQILSEIKKVDDQLWREITASLDVRSLGGQNALRQVVNLGKLVAARHKSGTEVPDYARRAIERIPYAELLADRRTAIALSMLAYHLFQVKMPTTQPMARLHLLFKNNSSIVCEPGIMKDWLWNLLLTDSRARASEWLASHQREYISALETATARETIFLCWNGWLISSKWVLAPLQETDRHLNGVEAHLFGSTVEDWELHCFAAAIWICGLQKRLELPPISDAEIKLARDYGNPATVALLMYDRMLQTHEPPNLAELDWVLTRLPNVARGKVRRLFLRQGSHMPLPPSHTGAAA
jgi:hypothetical protein